MPRKKIVIRLALLSSFAWVIWANMDMLGRSAEALRNGSREIKLKLLMQQMAQCIKIDYIDSRTLPRNPAQPYREAMAAEQRSVEPDVGKDPWGRWFRLVPSERGFYIVSSGPDRKFRTKDDVRFHQVLTDVGYTPPRKPKKRRKRRR